MAYLERVSKVFKSKFQMKINVLPHFSHNAGIEKNNCFMFLQTPFTFEYILWKLLQNYYTSIK